MSIIKILYPPLRAFWLWSKSFPTALVAIISAIIALLAYVYQRKEARKEPHVILHSNIQMMFCRVFDILTKC